MPGPEHRENEPLRAVANLDVVRFGEKEFHIVHQPTLYSAAYILFPDKRAVILSPKGPFSSAEKGGNMSMTSFLPVEEAYYVAQRMRQEWKEEYYHSEDVVENITNYIVHPKEPTFIDSNGHILEEEEKVGRAQQYRLIEEIGIKLNTEVILTAIGLLPELGN